MVILLVILQFYHSWQLKIAITLMWNISFTSDAVVNKNKLSVAEKNNGPGGCKVELGSGGVGIDEGAVQIDKCRVGPLIGRLCSANHDSQH